MRIEGNKERGYKCAQVKIDIGDLQEFIKRVCTTPGWSKSLLGASWMIKNDLQTTCTVSLNYHSGKIAELLTPIEDFTVDTKQGRLWKVYTSPNSNQSWSLSIVLVRNNSQLEATGTIQYQEQLKRTLILSEALEKAPIKYLIIASKKVSSPSKSRSLIVKLPNPLAGPFVYLIKNYPSSN